MRDAFRGRGRGRGVGAWRGSQRTTMPQPPQQQWKGCQGLVPGPEIRHFNPREARARPEREAEPPHGPILVHSPAPHRRRQQGQSLRKERAAPYEVRRDLGVHGGPSTGRLGASVVLSGGTRGGVEAIGGPMVCTGAVPVCNAPALRCSVYADQLIDYYTGKLCPRRFCIAYNEVSKLAKVSEVPHTPPGSAFPPLSIAGGGQGCAGIDQRTPQRPVSNGTVPECTPLEADEMADAMSEVSQVEGREADQEGPGVHGVRPNSPGQLGSLEVALLQGSKALTGSTPSISIAADTSQLVVQGISSSGAPQQQQIAGSSAARRDPRLAARARAEACGQQQQHVDAAPQVQQPDTDLPQQKQSEPHEPQQQQQDQQSVPKITLPPSLRRQPLLSKKLPLLLDLDNTLLHAQAVGMAGYHIALEDWLDEDGLPEVYKFELPCNRKVYYLKLRPGLRRFLKALAPAFELSIYTNATQEYADLVVAILDPDRTLFGDRIVARESSARGEQSENKTVRCLYGDLDRRCVVAFDDRQNIWTDLPVTHVVKAQHYDFFDSSRPELLAHYPHLPAEETMAGVAENPRQRSTALDRASPVPPAKRNLKRPYDWDRHMQHMVGIFLRVHQEFFKDPWNANVGTIITSFQSRALTGVGLFLTGYRKSFAPGSLVADCEERQTELAQRLGATVHRRFDEPGVTHVMAGKSNTNNMLALKEKSFQHLKKVHTLWLFSCESIWAKAPESCFSADALCALYDNQPPCAPFKDHWMHLADFSPPPVTAPAQPLLHRDRLPVREFLGTGPYSDGATLISPFEEIIFLWRPEIQPVRQLYSKNSVQRLPQALPADTSHQPQKLLLARPESRRTDKGGEKNDLPERSDQQNAEVIPFCNNQVYAV